MPMVINYINIKEIIYNVELCGWLLLLLFSFYWASFSQGSEAQINFLVATFASRTAKWSTGSYCVHPNV